MERHAGVHDGDGKKLLDGSASHSPKLTIDLRLPDGSVVPILAIVDSGADSTVVNIALLESFGVDFNVLKERNPLGPSRGIGEGQIDNARLEAQASYGGVVFAEAIRVTGPGAAPVALLGRGDFFRRFDISFEWRGNPPVFFLSAAARPAEDEVLPV